MVSNAGELFRRGARDETFGVEMGVISMIVKIEGFPKAIVVAAKPTGPAFGRPDDRLRASRGAKLKRESLLQCAAVVDGSPLFAGTTR
jgi:hypothetical protein